MQAMGKPVFNKVSGAANFVAAQDDLKNAFTAAYVIPLSDVAKPNDLMGMSVEQHIIERFGIVLAIRNYRDVRGGAVNSDLELVRKQTIGSLLGFVPATGYEPIQYGGGRILQLDLSTIWWQLEFTTGYYERNY
jgi:hypothetical protein